MIDEKFDVVFQILQPQNIPQKLYSVQNGPLDVMSQMRQPPTMEASDLKEKSGKTHDAIYIIMECVSVRVCVCACVRV